MSASDDEADKCHTELVEVWRQLITLPRTSTQGLRRLYMIKIGSKAPAFTLPDQDENKRDLKDLAGKGVVLFFYPKANTGG